MSINRGFRKKRRKERITRKQLFIISVVFCLFLGIITGSIYALTLSAKKYSVLQIKLSGYMHSFADEQDAISGKSTDTFKESSLKYIKLAVIIWILAFVPTGGFISGGIIFLRGFGYGFVTALLVRSYKLDGALCAALLYLPQALILIPAYLFSAFSCLNYIIFSLPRGKQRGVYRITNPAQNQDAAETILKADKTELINYFVPLCIGCMCCIIAGAADTFAVPMLIKRFLFTL